MKVTLVLHTFSAEEQDPQRRDSVELSLGSHERIVDVVAGRRAGYAVFDVVIAREH